MMKVWEIQNAYGIENLNLVEKPEPTPGPGQIVVSMKAASLNYRDLLTVIGYGGGFSLPLLSSSAGRASLRRAAATNAARCRGRVEISAASLLRRSGNLALRRSDCLARRYHRGAGGAGR